MGSGSVHREVVVRYADLHPGQAQLAPTLERPQPDMTSRSRDNQSSLNPTNQAVKQTLGEPTPSSGADRRHGRGPDGGLGATGAPAAPSRGRLGAGLRANLQATQAQQAHCRPPTAPTGPHHPKADPRAPSRAPPRTAAVARRNCPLPPLTPALGSAYYLVGVSSPATARSRRAEASSDGATAVGPFRNAGPQG